MASIRLVHGRPRVPFLPTCCSTADAERPPVELRNVRSRTLRELIFSVTIREAYLCLPTLSTGGVDPSPTSVITVGATIQTPLCSCEVPIGSCNTLVRGAIRSTCKDSSATSILGTVVSIGALLCTNASS